MHMHDLPQQMLCEIIAKHGAALGTDTKRCKALLHDLCGEYRGEIAALIEASKAGIPGQLLASQQTAPLELLLDRLAAQLQHNLALDEAAARWAVESWGLALGVITAAQVRQPGSIAPSRLPISSSPPSSPLPPPPPNLPPPSQPVYPIPPSIPPSIPSSFVNRSGQSIFSTFHSNWVKALVLGSLIAGSAVATVLLRPNLFSMLSAAVPSTPSPSAAPSPGLPMPPSSPASPPSSAASPFSSPSPSPSPASLPTLPVRPSPSPALPLSPPTSVSPPATTIVPSLLPPRDETPAITQQQTLDLISEWLQAKRVLFAPPYNRRLVEELTTGPLYKDLNKVDGPISWLETRKFYYRFGVQQIKLVEKFTSNGRQATIEVNVTEDRTLYDQNDRVVPAETDFKTRLIRYSLERVGNEWKIADYLILNNDV